MTERPPGGSPGTQAEVREAVSALLPAVERGGGSVVTLLGKAESGKSRLVSLLVREARDRGWTTLLATGTPRSGELPHGMVLDAMRPILPGLMPATGPSPTRASEPAGLGLPLALAAFLPVGGEEERPSEAGSMGSHAVPWELPSSLSPAEADRLLLRRLTDASKRGPVLLVLDDAQWMDELSQRFASTLCLSLKETRILFVISLDPEAAPPLVRRFAAREEGGLSDHVYRVVPAGSQRLRPLPPPALPALEPVEPSLLESLLSLGAVIGMEVDLRTLAELTGKRPEEILESLEEGARRGWLWRSGEESFHFSGERTWRWALGMPHQPLPVRHERVAKALEKLHPSPEGRVLFELAHHWQEAGAPSRAFPYMVRSAEAAFRAGAYETARDRLQRALGLLPSLPAEERSHEEVRILVDLAEVLDAMGEGSKAGARLREALTRAEVLHLPAREIVRVEVLLGDLQRRWGQGEQAFEVLERARARAAAAHDPATEATVLSRVAMVQRRQGHWSESRESVRRSLALLEDGHGGPEERALVHYAAADTYIWGGKEDDTLAKENIRKTREALREMGQVGREVPLMNLEGLHASQLGDSEEALRLWQGAADTALRLGNLVDAANMQGNLAEVYAERKRFKEAQASLSLAMELVQGMEEPRVRGQVHLAAATLAWRQGNTPQAERELDAGIELLASDASTDLRQQLEFLRARIRLEQGRPKEARELVSHLDRLRYPHLLPPDQKEEWERIHAAS
ncbi:MAG: AAA family ATPase [Euryarchaeota archaeon]|nr:AAA family ATPase [Euryarchaeota archaeon]